MTNTSKINTHTFICKNPWHSSKSGLKIFQKCEKCPPLLTMTFAVLASKIILLWAAIAQVSSENWKLSPSNFPQWIQCCQDHEWALFIFNLLYFYFTMKRHGKPGSTTKTDIQGEGVKSTNITLWMNFLNDIVAKTYV